MPRITMPQHVATEWEHVRIVTIAFRNPVAAQEATLYNADLNAAFGEDMLDHAFASLLLGWGIKRTLDDEYRSVVTLLVRMRTSIEAALGKIQNGAEVDFSGASGPSLVPVPHSTAFVLRARHWLKVEEDLDRELKMFKRYYELPRYGESLDTQSSPGTKANPYRTPKDSRLAGGSDGVCVVLSQAQQEAYNHILWSAFARRGEAAKMVPVSIMPNWSIPLLAGPASGGKTFTCREAARQLEGVDSFYRVDVGSWVLAASRTDRPTRDAIIKFVGAHPGGLIYVSGVDHLSSKRAGGAGDHNVSYISSVATEVSDLLDLLTSRDPDTTSGSVLPYVVLGGRFFSELWGDSDVGTAKDGDEWKRADGEQLTPMGAREWMVNQSGLPANLLRRTTIEPLMIGRIKPEEATRLAHRVVRSIPELEGILDMDELATALVEKEGWSALSRMIETALIDLEIAGTDPETTQLLAAVEREYVRLDKPSAAEQIEDIDLDAELEGARKRLAAKDVPLPKVFPPPGDQGDQPNKS